MDEHPNRNLDLYDALVSRFTPIEQLFKVMGGLDPGAVGGGELVRSCAEIGSALAAQFREKLREELRRDVPQGR